MSSLRDEIVTIKGKVDVYLEVGRFDTAEKLLKATLADYGHIANIHNLLGVTYHKQSKFNEAISEFRLAIACNPDFVEASLNLAATLCDLSQYGNAQKVFSKLETAVSPHKKIPNMFLGRIANQHAICGNMYAECKMNPEAIREFKSALSLYPQMPDVKLSLAKLYLKIGKTDEARLELEDLVRIDPNLSGARVWLGIVYYKLGQQDMARHQWETTHKNFPSDLSSRAYQSIVSNWSDSMTP